LKVSPKFEGITLDNKAQVGVEHYAGDSCCVSLFVKAGSRYETLKSSGAARVMVNLMLKGTSKMSRSDLDKKLLGMGAELEVTFERELIGLSL
jgi:predicted Zn-dependent peptidase